MITINCPECWLDVKPDMECRTCYGTGVVRVLCSQCLVRQAKIEQAGVVLCAECATDRRSDHES